MKRSFGVLILTLAFAIAGFGQASAVSSAQATKLKVGDMAPDFSLIDTNRNPVKLSDFRGKKNVVLAFYVLAFTGG